MIHVGNLAKIWFAKQPPQIGLAQLIAASRHTPAVFNAMFAEGLHDLVGKSGIRAFENESECVIAAAGSCKVRLILARVQVLQEQA